MSKTFEWNYNGDVNLREGGYYWRRDNDPENVYIVRVIPCSDMGKAYNEFIIQMGYRIVDVSEKDLKTALDCCGIDPEVEISFDTKVDILFSTFGFSDVDEKLTVRIGTKEDNSFLEDPDKVLRQGSSLRKFVIKNFLHKEPIYERSPTLSM